MVTSGTASEPAEIEVLAGRISGRNRPAGLAPEAGALEVGGRDRGPMPSRYEEFECRPPAMAPDRRRAAEERVAFDPSVREVQRRGR